MCGIAGIWSPGADPGALAARLGEAVALQVHRGPDGEGIWADPAGGPHLGHRRLAVLDLTDAADQPMISPDGRHALVFNGEIYNFRALREDPALAALGPWHSTGDTEVLLRALAVHGREALAHLDGMFALAFWDARERTLLLARDAFGEKPLYLSETGGGLAFASTLTSLLALLPNEPELDEDALALYWKQFAVAGPLTAWRDVGSLPPGSWLEMDARGAITRGSFWEPQYEEPHPVAFSDAVDAARAGLRDSLRRRLVSDVPLGCFLSGGVDSSLVTALTAAEFATPLNTFSVGFAGHEDEDWPFAQHVAERYGTVHEPVWLDETCLEELPRILWHYGQPYADFSCVPTWHVARAARRKVTVAVTGDGADELYAGYLSTRSLDLADRLRHGLPRQLLQAAAGATAAWRRRHRGDRWRRAGLLAAMAAADPAAACAILHDRPPLGARPRDAERAPDWVARWFDAAPERPVFQRSLLCDLRGRLVDNFLVKVDVAAMAHSLETRTPFLETSLFAQAAAWPRSVLLRRGTTKAVLKVLAEDYLPRDLLHRPKRGFTPPMGKWLAGPRYAPAVEWALSETGPAGPWLDPAVARAAWDQQRRGQQEQQSALFAVLAFALWWELFVTRRLDPATPLSGVREAVAAS
ncbi:MAG: asparagine synthase (glutamine-hydrolyzing) [Candidatus Krumholzibacteriota bacterium]|nr:asparagine synthase (glutamine-hydrolyzing) [Candidatus Krumholzibacteriota bacterium]